MPTSLCRAAVVLGLAAAACGAGDGAEVEAGAENLWERQHLDGELGPDYVVQMAADASDLVVAGASDDGFLHAFVDTGSGAFEVAPPVDLTIGYPGLGGVARFGDRWVALGGTNGDDGATFALQIFESTDGRAWSAVDPSGLDDPAEVGGLTAVDGGLVAAGTLRLADDLSRGGFRPAAWASRDGRVWTQTELPMGGAAEGVVIDVAAVDGVVLATGILDDRGALWSSTDLGASWSLVTAPGLPEASSFGGIAVADGTVALSAWRSTPELGEDGEYGLSLLLHSTDAGGHWSLASAPPPGRSSGFAGPIFTGAGYFFTIDEGDQGDGYEPEVCYDDVELCRNGPGPASAQPSLYASEDGDRWTRVDTRGIEGGPRFRAVGGAADGRIVALRESRGGTDAWIWPAGQPLAMRMADAGPPAPEADVDLIAWDDEVEPGHRYALPLSLHCGMDRLSLDGRSWQLVSPETTDGGGYPEEWPLVGEALYGFVTLVDADTVEYSIGDGEVIATYELATAEPPGCA
ncbi:MAG: hypothetical protein ABIP36_08290 [Acidimicrobiales bacterium]